MVTTAVPCRTPQRMALLGSPGAALAPTPTVKHPPVPLSGLSLMCIYPCVFALGTQITCCRCCSWKNGCGPLMPKWTENCSLIGTKIVRGEPCYSYAVPGTPNSSNSSLSVRVSDGMMQGPQHAVHPETACLACLCWRRHHFLPAQPIFDDIHPEKHYPVRRKHRWAHSLVLPCGRPRRCDLDNAGRDFFEFIPASYSPTVPSSVSFQVPANCGTWCGSRGACKFG